MTSDETHHLDLVAATFAATIVTAISRTYGWGSMFTLAADLAEHDHRASQRWASARGLRARLFVTEHR